MEVYGRLDTEDLLGCDLCVKSVTCVENKDHLAVADFSDMALLVPDLQKVLVYWREIFHIQNMRETVCEIAGNTCRAVGMEDGLFPVYLIETRSSEWLEQHRKAHGGLFFLALRTDRQQWQRVREKANADSIRLTLFDRPFECLLTVNDLAANIASREGD